MDEYQRGNINCPIAPAIGKTGSNIAEYLGTVLSRIEPQRFIVPGYLVIISNPIQFQTSLHAIHGMSPRADKGKWGTLRDNVWRTLWAEPHIQRCFKKRLEGYCPKVIINACTGDLKKRCSLKNLVNRFVLEKFSDVPLYTVAHPVSWLSLRPKPINS